MTTIEETTNYNCKNCLWCYCCKNCEDCTNCINCDNLIYKNNYINNKSYSKEEFKKIYDKLFTEEDNINCELCEECFACVNCNKCYKCDCCYNCKNLSYKSYCVNNE